MEFIEESLSEGFWQFIKSDFIQQENYLLL